MPDSATKLSQNRIHLFDPVGLITDGYVGRDKASDDAVRSRTETECNSFTDTTDNDGFRSYDSFTMEIKGGRLTYDQTENSNDTNKSGNPDVDLFQAGSIEIPMYTAVTIANKTYDYGDRLRFGVDDNRQDECEVSSPRFLNPNPRSIDASPLRLASPKSLDSSPWNPASPRFVNSSPNSPVHPNHHHNHNQTMSPNSRIQAISRGRKELMELVRDLPETCYELSLRDIVEQKQGMEAQNEMDPAEDKKPVKEMSRAVDKKEKRSGKNVKSEKKKKNKKMVRSRSTDNGKFLLKTSVFPVFLGSKKNKQSLGPSGSFKVAPIPPKRQPASTGSMKGSEKEWWKRKSCISSESDESNGLSSNSSSSGSSRSSSRSNSNSSDGRRSSRFLPTCCFSLKRIGDKK